SYLLLAGPGFWEFLGAQLARDRPGTRRRRLAERLEQQEPPLHRPTTRSERVNVGVREAHAGVCCFVVVRAALAQSRHLPASMRPEFPPALRTIQASLLISQDWGLFAPHAPTEEGFFVIVATTVDERQIDPLRGGAPMTEILPGYGARTPQEDVAYSIRMRKGLWQSNLTELERKIWSYELETGRPEDLIIRYELYN